MDNYRLEDMLGKWEKSTRERSGNLTTHDHLPADIRQKLLLENRLLAPQLEFEELTFLPLCPELDAIEGMEILSGLQKMKKEGNITIYRAVRFPTLLRIWQAVSDLGLSIPNYEQQRILHMYGDPNYQKKRENIKKDSRFWTQPQERVVNGVPVFCLVNDAMQIHHAYRNEKDRVLIIGIHIPYTLLYNENVQLIANSAIDLDFDNDWRDFRIMEFQERDNAWVVDYKVLRTRGIDLHEMYIVGLPYDLEGHKQLGIEQQFFLLDIYRVDPKDPRIKNLSSAVLKEHAQFLHGFYGDQTVFGRRPSTYLPSRCIEVSLKR